MAELTVDLTYGNALYQAARDLDKVGLISEEASGILEIFENEPGFLELLNSPAVAAVEKKEIVTKVFSGKICDELVNFMYVLIDKSRTRHFKKIVSVYKDLINKVEGFAYGEILSVEPLSEERLRAFEAETGKLLQLNVKLTNRLAPDLIGGVKIFINGKVIDASIRSRLKDMKDSLEQ